LKFSITNILLLLLVSIPLTFLSLPHWPDSAGLAQNANGERSLIAYTSEVNGVMQVFTMDPDGSNRTQLTFNSEGRALHPAWSPDGNKIIYVVEYNFTTPNRITEFYTIKNDGSDHVLVPNSRDGHNPSWSPNGQRIVFDRSGDILAMNLDGTALEQLTSEPSSDRNPDWSPDGSMISFESNRNSSDSGGGIYIIDSDGSNLRQLTFNPVQGDFCSSWSRTNGRILFAGHRLLEDSGVYQSDLFIIDPDSSNFSRLTRDDIPELYPSFSPDGLHVVYLKANAGDFSIYRIDTDGTNETRVTTMEQLDEDPAWSPIIQNN
jgi:Tol biopolymer transport system component